MKLILGCMAYYEIDFPNLTEEDYEEGNIDFAKAWEEIKAGLEPVDFAGEIEVWERSDK